MCARAPLTAVCSCPISSAARRLRKASSPGKGTDVSLICPPIGVLQKARVGFVQYACRVRRWQMTMACHHHMNKVWAYAMCTLRRVVGRQEQQRASVYRGIWFWKYWRLAMTLCRLLQCASSVSPVLISGHNLILMFQLCKGGGSE